MVKIFTTTSTCHQHQGNDVNYVLQWFEEFCEPICNFRAARFKFTKVCQQTEVRTLTLSTTRILKVAHQCDFSNINEQLIDAIIFRTTCVKAQDKLLQMPNTLSLQQCLTVCRHYECLSLHIQQIHSGADKQVEILSEMSSKVEETWFQLSCNRKVRIRRSLCNHQ